MLLEAAPAPAAPSPAEAEPADVPSPLRRTAVALPQLTTGESAWVRWLYALMAIAFAGLCLYAAVCLWTPAHGGVDQNGYLVGGKQFARTLSMGLTPEDPFGFVGRMWIGTPSQTFYPKYPLGLPFLFALGFWFGGEHGVAWAHLVSPVCTALSLVGCFFLIRLVVPSFYAFLGAIVLITSPVTLWSVNNPNSHASTLACVVWGMYLLVRWWQVGGLWRARGAGLLIGYAATIRYTEGLLVLPVLLVVLFKVFPTFLRRSEANGSPDTTQARSADRRLQIREGLVLLGWWVLPIFILVSFNLFWFGDLTGYDSTKESTGFRWEYFVDNWETMLRQLNTGALFFTLPLGVIGVAFMFAWSARFAAMLTAWILPSVLLYTAYYWAPDRGGLDPGVGYMRFFLTIMPALVLAAMWFIRFVAASVVVSRRAAMCTTSALVALLAIINVMAWDLTTLAAVRMDLADSALFTAGLTEPGWLLLRYALYGAVMACVSGIIWFVQHHWVSQETDTTQAAGIVIGTLVTAFAGSVQLFNGCPMLENDYRGRLSLAESGHHVRQAIPDGSIILGPTNVLHHLQFIGDYRLYDPNYFSAGTIRRLGNVNPDEPDPLQAQRALYLYEQFKDESDAQLQARLNGIVRRALNWGQSVYYVGTRDDLDRRLEQVRRRHRGEWTEANEREALPQLVLRGAAGARDLKADIVDRWPQPPVVLPPQPEGRRPRGPASRRQRWSQAGEWVLVEVTRADPAPPPVRPRRR